MALKHQISGILGRLRRAVNEYAELNKKHRSLRPAKRMDQLVEPAAGVIKISVECLVSDAKALAVLEAVKFAADNS